MRLLSLLLLACLSLGANAAQPETAPAQVPGEEQLDEQPVNISKQSEETTIEEFRANGRLYMIKVTPKHGAPYYLVDDLGDGRFARHEGLDSGLRVPRWIIKSF
jgi:hypothetical protein